MPRGAAHSEKPTQKQRERDARRGKRAVRMRRGYKGVEHCDCCPPKPHPALDWVCLGCQRHIASRLADRGRAGRASW